MDDFTYIGGELDLFEKALRWKSYFRAHLRPFLGKRVLEVGAGTGGTTKILCDGSQQQWTCLEPDADLAARLGPMIEARKLPACCRVEVGTTLDLKPADAFDTILYIDVLEHIEDDAAELARAAALLSPGGHLVALSPAYPRLYSKFDASIGHYRRYTRRSLATIAPPSLELVRIANLDSVGIFASLANRAILRRGMPTARQVAVWDRVMVPLSRVLDPLLLHRVGKSIAAVWHKRL